MCILPRRKTKRSIGLALTIICLVLLTYLSTFLEHPLKPGGFVTQISTKETAIYNIQPPDLDLTRLDPVSMADNTLLLLKTGIDVSWPRIPSHLTTTFEWYPHKLVYGDGSASIANVEVINVFDYIPSDIVKFRGFEGYLIREESLKKKWGWGFDALNMDDGDLGWNLDKFKNIPAFAHAYINHPNYDWYLMIDDDTVLLPSTIAAATAGMDPNEPHFLGRDVGWKHMFAHGGSGLLLSRRALELTYGNTERSAEGVVQRYMSNVYKHCCGDDAFGSMVYKQNGCSRDDLEFHHDHAYFQGGKLSEQKATFDYWCESVGSFHHMEPWETVLLGEWYTKLKTERDNIRYVPTYSDFYNEFIMPLVVDEIQGWVMHFKIEDSLKRAHDCYFKDGDIRAVDKHSCKRACEDRDNCFAWSFKGHGNCEIFDFGMVSGRSMRPEAPYWSEMYRDSVSGFMVERIKERRKQQKCDPSFGNDEYVFTEGWLVRSEFSLDNITINKPLLDSTTTTTTGTNVTTNINL